MSTLIAPSHHSKDLNEYHHSGNPNPEPGAQHYVITRRSSTDWDADGEIVYDAGWTHLGWPEVESLRADLRLRVQALDQASYDEHVRGVKYTRYTCGRGGGQIVAVDEAAGLEQLARGCQGQSLTATPNVEIMYISSDGDNGAVLWSDGVITRRPLLCYWPTRCGCISESAFRLIQATRLQKAWRPEAWRKLTGVQSVVRENVKQFRDRWEGIGAHGSDEYTLDRLTTDTGLVLYELSQQGGAMGEDGDAWEYYYLFEDEHEARAAYRKEILTVLIASLSQAERWLEQGMWLAVARAWPLEAGWAKANFDVVLPLQEELAAALKQQDAFDAQFAELDDVFEIWAKAAAPDLPVERPVVDEHGWAMYLKGFAKAL